jgi:hypothetical protein
MAKKKDWHIPAGIVRGDAPAIVAGDARPALQPV